MTNKDKFLQRKFLYDLQCPIAVLLPIIIWYLWLFLLVRIIDVNDSLIGSFVSSTLFLVFGFYNLFTYIWSKYGIELFGDLDQEWLRKEQGYDAKNIWGDIFKESTF